MEMILFAASVLPVILIGLYIYKKDKQKEPTRLLISLFITEINSALSVLSFVDFYRNFAMGIISFESIISLLLFTCVFIALTIIVMQRRKLVK